MKKHIKTTLNPYSWLLIALGACSAKTTLDAFNPIPVNFKYSYTCSAEDGDIGIRDLQGAFSVYKNNQILFANHQGADLSFFFTTQEPNVSVPTLKGFSLENQPDEALQYFALNFEMNLESGDLSVEEEKYERTSPTEPWELSSTKKILSANSCHILSL